MAARHYDPKKLTTAQRRCLLRLAEAGPQQASGPGADGKQYTQPHRYLVLKKLARFVDVKGALLPVDRIHVPRGMGHKCQITEAGRRRLRTLGILTLSDMCDELAARGVSEKLLAPIRTGEPPGTSLDQGFAVYEQAKALKLGWAIIGFDHDWRELAIFLDEWAEHKRHPRGRIPGQFTYVEGCIIAASSVAYGLPSGDWSSQTAIQPGGQVQFTVTPVVDHRPLRFLVAPSCAPSFRIDMLRAGVEPLVHGGAVSLSLAARLFSPSTSPPVALRPLLIERGTDVSVTVTNTGSKAKKFAATLVATSLGI